MRRTKAEAAETREAILCCAELIFFKKGLAHTTLEEIAKAAGVTRGAIYWHFQNKTDIFLELFDKVRQPQQTIIDLDALDSAEADALSFLEKISCNWLDALVADEQHQRLLTILLRNNLADDFAEIQAAKAALEDEQIGILTAVLERAEAQKILDPAWSVQSAATAFRWLMKGMSWEWLLSMHAFDLPTEGKKAVRTFLKTLRKP